MHIYIIMLLQNIGKAHPKFQKNCLRNGVPVRSEGHKLRPPINIIVTTVHTESRTPTSITVR